MSRIDEAFRDAQIAAARKMIGNADPERVGWRRIAEAVGLSSETLQRALRPGFGERRNAMNLAARKRRGDFGKGSEVRNIASAAVKPRDIAKRLAERPTYDPRSLTARIFGDPIPGRRAIDMELRDGD